MSDTWPDPETVLDIFRDAWERGIPDSVLLKRGGRLTVGMLRNITQGKVHPELFKTKDMGKGRWLVAENRDGANVYTYLLGARRNPMARVRGTWPG